MKNSSKFCQINDMAPSTILLMEEILHQLIGSLSVYLNNLQGFIHPRWFFGMSSINNITQKKESMKETPSSL